MLQLEFDHFGHRLLCNACVSWISKKMWNISYEIPYYIEQNAKNKMKRSMGRSELGSLLLTDAYVVEKIIRGTNLKKSTVPKELIELKRQELILRKFLENGTNI